MNLLSFSFVTWSHYMVLLLLRKSYSFNQIRGGGGSNTNFQKKIRNPASDCLPRFAPPSCLQTSTWPAVVRRNRRHLPCRLYRHYRLRFISLLPVATCDSVLRRAGLSFAPMANFRGRGKQTAAELSTKTRGGRGSTPRGALRQRWKRHEPPRVHHVIGLLLLLL
ncbi:unnamed protein product [Ectocarpus sp. 12 AP-2014]